MYFCFCPRFLSQRRTRKNSLVVLVSLVLAILTSVSVQAQKNKPALPYTCIPLGTLGGDFSHANAVNQNGEVVGYSTFTPGTVTLNNDERAFYWKDLNANNVSDPGEMVYLGSLGYNSVANDINDQGDIVGFSKIINAESYAVLFQAQAPHTITYLRDLIADPIVRANWLLDQAQAINNNRQVVGWGRRLDRSDLFACPYMLDLNTGLLTDLGEWPGLTYLYAWGVNNLAAPQVVGRTSGSPTQGFLYSNGTLATLSPMTAAYGINDGGAVVGVVNGHPAYWSGVANAPVVDLGTFGLATNKGSASAINNYGLVVGNTGSDKPTSGFTTQYAFRWQAGTAVSTKQNLNSLTSAPFVLRHALDVSDNGLIVGYGSPKSIYSDPSVQDQAYLLKPN